MSIEITYNVTHYNLSEIAKTTVKEDYPEKAYRTLVEAVEKVKDIAGLTSIKGDLHR